MLVYKLEKVMVHFGGLLYKLEKVTVHFGGLLYKLEKVTVHFGVSVLTGLSFWQIN